MPAFRQRPLTWLFWIATLCADAVGVFKGSDGDWVGPLLYGQLYVICGWAAISDANRLGRAALVIVAPLAIGLFVYVHQRAPDEGPYVLAFSLILAAVMFVATRVLAILVRAMPGERESGGGKKWQISIAEIFGWTIVTAILSWAATMSKMPPLGLIAGIWALFFSPLPAAVMIAGFLAPRRRHDLFGLIASLAALVAFMLMSSRWGASQISSSLLFGGMFAYVAMWVLVVRLDEGQAASVEPKLELYVEDEEASAMTAATRAAPADRHGASFDEL